MSAHMVEHELIDVLVTAALYGTSRCDQDQRPLTWPGVPVDPHQVAIPGDWWGEFERAGLLWREFQERVTRENATQVGRMLLSENATSVGYRYMGPDGTLNPEGGGLGGVAYPVPRRPGPGGLAHEGPGAARATGLKAPAGALTLWPQ